MTDELLALLSDLMAGERSIPLSISLKDEKEVVDLRNQITALEAEILALRVKYDRTEYLYRCESNLNNRLVDLCRVSGIQLGPEFFIRPDEFQKQKKVLSKERTPPAKAAD